MCTTSQIPDYVQIAEIMKTSTDMVEGLGKLFKFFDENGDGKLSKIEAQNGFEMIGKWEGAMKDDFEAMAGFWLLHLKLHLLELLSWKKHHFQEKL